MILKLRHNQIKTRDLKFCSNYFLKDYNNPDNRENSFLFDNECRHAYKLLIVIWAHC